LATDTEGQQQTAPPQRTERPQRDVQRRRRTFHPRARKRCAFCEKKALQIDYKKVDLLKNYMTDRGKIKPRRRTGLCARHQRRLTTAIKRARHLALLPFTIKYLRTS